MPEGPKVPGSCELEQLFRSELFSVCFPVSCQGSREQFETFFCLEMKQLRPGASKEESQSTALGNQKECF